MMLYSYWQCLWTVLKHKWYVMLSAHMVGLKWWQVIGHDMSKLGWSEFLGYVYRFYAGSPRQMAYVMEKAWLHHQNHEMHHPEYWVPRTNMTAYGYVINNGCLEMSHRAAKEMVLDWLAAGMAYNGSWDIGGWLSGNFSKKQLHYNTRQYVIGLLQFLGYHDLS